MKTSFTKAQLEKTIIKKCHVCGHVMEGKQEIHRCDKCQKSFLPTNYHAKTKGLHKDFNSLFSPIEELNEQDVVKGLSVIW